MMLKLNNKETGVVMSALAMAERHYRTRMAESEDGTRVYYDKLVETTKALTLRMERSLKKEAV